MEISVDTLPEILFAHRFSCRENSWRLPQDENMLEISTCLSGEMRRSFGGLEETFTEGEIFLTHHRCPYMITTAGAHTHITVALRIQPPKELAARLPDKVRTAACPEALKAMMALANADPTSLRAKTMAMVLLNALDTYYQKKHKVDNPHYIKALNYISEHLSEVTLEDAAGAASISKGYLEALFREHGTTFVGHLNALRVSRAGQLMLAKGITARYAAEQVGIDDPKYFSRLFRRYNGMSIREFRAQHSW